MRKTLIPILALLVSHPASAKSWSGNMQSLFQSLQELMVYTVDDARYADPKNAKAIERAAEAMMKGSHDAAKMRSAAPDADPSVGIYAALLKDETKRGYDAFRTGHREYARGIFKSVAATCIACHTRNSAGARLNWDFSHGFSKGLPLYQQAELLAAGRSFPAALDALDQVLADSMMAKNRPFDWNRALRYALAVAIRTEKSPERAMAILDRAMKVEGAPQFSKLDSQDWLRSLQAWKGEGKTVADSEEALYAESRRLMSLAQSSQRYPMDRAGDVSYLRATATLHRLLQVAPTGVHSGEAFLLLGSCYEVLRDFDLWGLGEIYYEACINRAPHSDTAVACLRRYEESVTAGYTGSAGTQIPEASQKKLASLRALASPQGGEKKPQ